MGRGTGQTTKGNSTSLLYGAPSRRADHTRILRQRDERLFVELFGQEFCEELKEIAVERMEATYAEGHGRHIWAIEPRRCHATYREDIAVLPEVAEPHEDLIFMVYARFAETGRAGAGGGALDRSAEIHITPAEIEALGWRSERLTQRCREAVMERVAA